MADKDHDAGHPKAAANLGEKEKGEKLENKVDKEYSAIGEATNAIIGGGAIAASYLLWGLDGLSVSASFPIGAAISDGGLKSKNYRNESIIGA